VPPHHDRARHRPLSDRQRRFVEEYLVDMNTKAAARRAGYKTSNAFHSLIKGHPEVRAAIDEALAEKRSKSAVDRERVMVELQKIAFGNIGDYFAAGEDGELQVDVEALHRDHGTAVRRAVVEYFPDQPDRVQRVTIVMNDKVAALREISRHLGLYPPELRGRGRVK
jgi:phage terminase small subunit